MVIIPDTLKTNRANGGTHLHLEQKNTVVLGHIFRLVLSVVRSMLPVCFIERLQKPVHESVGGIYGTKSIPKEG